MFINFVAINKVVPQGVAMSAPVADIREVYVDEGDTADRYTVKLASGGQYAFLTPTAEALGAKPPRPLDVRSKGNKAAFAALGIKLEDLPLK